MTITLTAGDSIHCPHCKEKQDDKVEDHVIPGRVGQASTQAHECWNCDARFTVCLESNGTFTVLG